MAKVSFVAKVSSCHAAILGVLALTCALLALDEPADPAQPMASRAALFPSGIQVGKKPEKTEKKPFKMCINTVLGGGHHPGTMSSTTETMSSLADTQWHKELHDCGKLQLRPSSDS